MKFNDEERSQFNSIIKPYIDNELVQSMKNYIQHGRVSTYAHSLNVARTCYSIDKRLSSKSDKVTLLTAAILHDFYLYDWHNKSIDKRKGLHGFTHPNVAAENAKKYFDITPKVENAIRSHMWPLTITKLPKSREAWILCIADTFCAIKEMFGVYPKDIE